MKYTSLLVFAAGWLAGCEGSVSPGRTPGVPEMRGPASPATPTGGSTGTPEGPSPSPSPPRDPAAAEVIVGRGLLDCPAVAAPPYEDGSSREAALSAAFGRYCSGCHGASGEGRGAYPRLPGPGSLAQFSEVVRRGRPDKGMPAFGPEVLSDADLRADFAALGRGGGQAGGATRLVAAEQTWSSERVEDAYRRGLAAWRKPDSHGAACASCHAPDALDLAVIAYRDEAILRRGGLHLPPDDVLAIRDLVHAQRRRFGITQPCSVAWRPFQPGGEVLPGDTPEAQDHAFAQELTRLGVLLMGEPVRDAAAAERALAQFARLDLRKVRIGIPLPHWTRDPFNGDDHRTFDDWIGAVDVTPNLAAYVSASDRYLADPSDDQYFALERAAVGSLGNAMGGQFHDWFRNVSRAKRRAILLGSHYFRRELLGRDGDAGRWYTQPAVPYPERPFRYSPFALMGGMTQEYACSPSGGGFGGGTCAQLLGRVAADQRPKFGTTDQEINARLESFTHTWWTIANLFDQGMMRSEDDAIDGGMFYWGGRFPQSAVHMPVFYAHGVATRWLYQTTLQAQPAFPVVARKSARTFLLDGAELHDRALVGLVGGLPPESSPAFEDSLWLRANLLRTLLLLQQDLLARGHEPHDVPGLLDLHKTGLPSTRNLVDDLVTHWRDPGFEARHPRLAGKAADFGPGLAALWADVVARLEAR